MSPPLTRCCGPPPGQFIVPTVLVRVVGVYPSTSGAAGFLKLGPTAHPASKSARGAPFNARNASKPRCPTEPVVIRPATFSRGLVERARDFHFRNRVVGELFITVNSFFGRAGHTSSRSAGRATMA